MITKEIAAYAAGLFDGEGYVGIDKTCIGSGKSRSVHRGIKVIISQKDGQIMNWLKMHFGGNAYCQRNGTKYYIHRWRVHAEKADQFLKTILPYVIIKKPQVEFVLRFNEERKQRLEESKRSTKTGRFLPMTKEETTWRTRKHEELITLKKVYTPYIIDTVLSK